MKFLCILFGFLVWSGCCFSDSSGRIDLRDYVYDEQGSPIFIKIYIGSGGLSRVFKKSIGCSSLRAYDAQAILSRMVQEDRRGSYVVIPIKKKKSKDKEGDNKDESVWACPHCGRENKASEQRCRTDGCPFNC